MTGTREKILHWGEEEKQSASKMKETAESLSLTGAESSWERHLHFNSTN